MRREMDDFLRQEWDASTEPADLFYFFHIFELEIEVVIKIS